jgi:uncharacterized repeat protein (TIGR01451 family)
MKRFLDLLTLSSTIIILLTLVPGLFGAEHVGYAASNATKAYSACDIATRFESNFRQMVEIRAENPNTFSNEAFKTAALNYIASANRCYLETVPQASLPANAPGATMIDEGGVWFPGFGPSSDDLSPQYLTFGTKWGSGSPFSGGQDVPGPGIAGGTVTYSYMANGVSHAVEGRGGNTHISGLTGFSGCFYTEISTAFAAWSVVANIQFVEVPDNGVASNGFGAQGDIRIGAHWFDGSSGILAHAFYPPPNGTSIAGDLHFDSAETWSCTPGGGFDIGLVTLHEIGHSIGLGHEPSELAVMNAFYNSSLSGLQTDDVNGAVSIYGAAPPILNAGAGSDPFPIQAYTTVITYAVNIYNTSNIHTTNVMITNTIPASTTYVSGSASDSGHETSPGSKVITWPTTSLNGNSIISRTFQVTVTAAITDGDTLINTLSVSSAEGASIQSLQLISFVNPQLVYLPLLFKDN